MIIFALDAGFVLPGYAFFDTVTNTVINYGSVASSRTAKKERKPAHFYVSHDDARRTQNIFSTLDVLIKQIHPTFATVELPIGAGRSSSAVKGMAYATAIAAILLSNNGIDDYLYVTPEQNKVASTGIKTASKLQVLQGVSRRFQVNWKKDRNGSIDNPHNWAVADALSTIMYYESRPASAE